MVIGFRLSVFSHVLVAGRYVVTTTHYLLTEN